jgi:hypothetical protein
LLNQGCPVFFAPAIAQPGDVICFDKAIPQAENHAPQTPGMMPNAMDHAAREYQRCPLFRFPFPVPP